MKTEGVILAAGFSTRAGKNKLTLDLYGKTVIERCISGMYDLCSKITVVGGHRIEDIKDILDEYSKVELIYNTNYSDGMFSSVKKGLNNVTGERFFFIPGDYSAIDKKVYEKMLEVDEDIVIPLYNERRGHPLLMKKTLIDDLLNDTNCKNLRDFINKKGFIDININDPGILMDIDTIEDYKKILSYLADKY